MGQQEVKQCPFVSVIMPIRNEEDFIERSLGAILSQSYPAESLEVLISDGMSNDNTRSLIQTMPNPSNIPIQIIDNPRIIVPTGFNLALAEAKGNIIIRVDGHTIIEKDYIRECVNTLARTSADNVGGRMNAIGEGSVGKAIALATSSPFGIGGSRFHYSTKEEWVDTVYMGAWRRDVFNRLGGFDEEFVRNQDDEFNYRLRSHGGKILLNPKIQSVYYNRSTLKSLWKQYYQYGFYKVRVMQKHPRQMRPRQFAPFLLVISMLGCLLLSLFIPILRIIGVALFAIYGFSNLLATLTISNEQLSKTRWLLPIVFVVLHFSYGLGFMVGLVKRFIFPIT